MMKHKLFRITPEKLREINIELSEGGFVVNPQFGNDEKGRLYLFIQQVSK